LFVPVSGPCGEILFKPYGYIIIEAYMPWI